MLISKYKESKTISTVAETYSILQQAYKLAVNEKNTPENWNISGGTSTGAKNMAEPIIKNLKVIQDCGTTSNGNIGKHCISNTKMKYLDGTFFNGSTWNLATYSSVYKVLLINGVSLTFHPRSKDCSSSPGELIYCSNKTTTACSCGYILADIDGPNKGQNRLGWDLFQFILTDHGIFPNGGNTKNKYIVGDTTEGWGSTWWVLNKKNTDYQKCLKDLKINGKSKCK